MDFHEEREGREELEDNGLFDDGNDEDEAEEDELQEPPINLFLSCQRIDDKQPCDKLGRCVTFDQANVVFTVCEHFNIDIDEEAGSDWEEN